MRLASLLLLLASAACTADSFSSRVDLQVDRALGAEQQRARRAVLDTDEAFLAVSSRAALSRRWSVLTFLFGDETDGLQGRVRRASGGYREPTRISWAAETCSALEQLLLDLEAFRAPLIDAPGVGWEPSGRIVLTADGTSYWLVAKDFQTDSITEWRRLEIDAHSGSELGDWVDKTATALEPCWTDDPPSTD